MGDCEYLGGSYYNDPFTQSAFLGANDDLNSFFTPGLDGPNRSIVFPNPIESLQTEQWGIGDESQIFASQQDFPFPIVPLQLHTQQCTGSNSTMDASSMASQYDAPTEVQPPASIAEEQPQSPINPEKPRRGRPRKRKRKYPLSEEEQQRKRKAFLERNRRAASKCRKRKKESIENIQARASILDKKSRMLTVELMLMRAEYTKWLNLAIEHTKSCPDDPNFQEYLNAAETRLVELSNFVPLGRTEEWDKHVSETTGDKTGTTVSDSMSPTDTSNLQALELGYFYSVQYEKSRQLDQASQQQPTDKHLESAEMERKHSTSTVGASREAGSAKDSAYYSASDTFTGEHGSPVLKPSREEQKPEILPNPRHPGRIAAPNLQQPTPRQLRSSTSAGGPVDLDNPFAYLQHQSRN